MTTRLAALKRHSLVVADTGDIRAIQRYRPTDATTNPSLLLKAFQLDGYQSLIDESLRAVKAQTQDVTQQTSLAVDQLAVAIGSEIAALIPGRVSTEVSARLSFDTRASIIKAHELIALYERRGIPKDRVLIKLASTWEGIRAAERLEREGIACNLTLLFSEAQAQACFDAGVTLISPFVGRVTDWHSKASGRDFSAQDDPGVRFVKGVCRMASAGGHATIVMGASFRTTGQVLALAGCHRLTISPTLLEELAASTGDVERCIDFGEPRTPRPAALTEADFRWAHNLDAMANDKLAEGVRRFAEDQASLEALIAARLQAL